MTVIQGKDIDGDKRSLTAKAVSQFVGSWQQGCRVSREEKQIYSFFSCILSPQSKI